LCTLQIHCPPRIGIAPNSGNIAELAGQQLGIVGNQSDEKSSIGQFLTTKGGQIVAAMRVP
jgi:hypothetical protein